MDVGKWDKKHLLGIKELSKEEIEFILKTAQSFKEVSSRSVKKVPALRGKTIVNFFAEPSTRTRVSFELAAKRLSADTINITASSSSIVKGETIEDTARNLEALNVDTIIIRHSCPGVPHILASVLKGSVINAGDGAHEHPTQALLDMFTIQEYKGRIKDLKITIIGDIRHSRVARSNIWGLTKLGAKVTVCGPATLIPVDLEKSGVKVTYNLKEAIADADVLNILRVQKERQESNFFPSLREYARIFGVNSRIVKKLKKDVLIMHPGPMNRGVEISSDIADGENSVILNQVTNGLAVRMAVLFLTANVKSEKKEVLPKLRKKENKR